MRHSITQIIYDNWLFHFFTHYYFRQIWNHSNLYLNWISSKFAINHWRRCRDSDFKVIYKILNEFSLESYYSHIPRLHNRIVIWALPFDQINLIDNFIQSFSSFVYLAIITCTDNFSIKHWPHTRERHRYTCTI